MSKYTIKAADIDYILEDIGELESRLTERISDLHEVQGGMQARHAYIFYRKLLCEIRDKFQSSIKEEKI